MKITNPKSITGDAVTNYYALLDTGDIVYLGEFEDFESADQCEKAVYAVWIVDEEHAVLWLNQLKEMVE